MVGKVCFTTKFSCSASSGLCRDHELGRGFEHVVRVLVADIILNKGQLGLLKTNGGVSGQNERCAEHEKEDRIRHLDRISARGQRLAGQSRERPFSTTAVREEIAVFICIEWDHSPSETGTQTVLSHFVV
jgi:hypothetical protein